MNRKGSFAKARKLVDLISELPSAKEEIYGALDAFVAWELEFPIVAIKKALQFMAEDQQWKRVIQVGGFRLLSMWDFMNRNVFVKTGRPTPSLYLQDQQQVQLPTCRGRFLLLTEVWLC